MGFFSSALVIIKAPFAFVLSSVSLVLLQLTSCPLRDFASWSVDYVFAHRAAFPVNKWSQWSQWSLALVGLTLAFSSSSVCSLLRRGFKLLWHRLNQNSTDASRDDNCTKRSISG